MKAWIKKAAAAAMAATMAVSLMACGGGSSSGSSASGDGAGGSGTHIYVLTPPEDHGWTGSVATFAKTIIINTLEIPEIQQVADFCVIFYNGSIIKILEHDEIEETKVMLYSTNAVNAGK